MYENGIAECFKNYIFGIYQWNYDNFGGFSITLRPLYQAQNSYFWGVILNTTFKEKVGWR